MNPSTTKSGDRFNRATKEAGCFYTNCGPMAAQLALRIERGPIYSVKVPCCYGRRIHEWIVPENNGMLGALIKNGLVRFEPGAKRYDLTPKGAQWLADLRRHDLIGEVEA